MYADLFPNKQIGTRKEFTKAMDAYMRRHSLTLDTLAIAAKEREHTIKSIYNGYQDATDNLIDLMLLDRKIVYTDRPPPPPTEEERAEKHRKWKASFNEE